MSVKAGYELGRDENGLTNNEREVLGRMAKGLTPAKVAVEMNLSRQRTSKIAKDLVEKGWLIKGEGRGQYAIEAKKLPEIQTFLQAKP